MFRRVDRLAERLFLRDAIETDVDRNAMQPRRERRLPLEMSQALPRAHERILRQVAGVLVIVHEAIADLVDRAAMPLDDHIERLAVAGDRLRHQRRIVELGEWRRHRQRPRPNRDG